MRSEGLLLLVLRHNKGPVGNLVSGIQVGLLVKEFRMDHSNVGQILLKRSFRVWGGAGEPWAEVRARRQADLGQPSNNRRKLQDLSPEHHDPDLKPNPKVTQLWPHNQLPGPHFPTPLNDGRHSPLIGGVSHLSGSEDLRKTAMT